MIIYALSFFISIAAAENDPVMAKLKNFSADYVVVQFWNPTCQPCGEEVHELNDSLQVANRDGQRLVVLGIPVQSRKKEIDAFVDHFHPNYEQWMLETIVAEKYFKQKTVPLTILYAGKEKLKVKEWNQKIKSVELLSEIRQLDQKKEKI